MSNSEKSERADTEGSKAVLNEVKGRLERMETGDMPVIQRVGPDGTSRRVDHTGEMVRPDEAEVDAARAAAEAFAAEHRLDAASPRPEPPPEPATAAVGPPAEPNDSGRPGLWARITAWLRRS